MQRVNVSLQDLSPIFSFVHINAGKGRQQNAVASTMGQLGILKHMDVENKEYAGILAVECCGIID